MTYRVYLCVSRNKDNKDLKDFKQRSTAFLAKENSPSVERRFKEFVLNGVIGEVNRLYESVNSRNMAKVRKQLLKRLIDDEELDLTKTTSIIGSIAACKECANERKWLLDIDDPNNLSEIEQWLKDRKIDYHTYKTLNNFAIIVERGFDCREFNFNDVEIKKDDYLFIKSEITR